MTSTPRRPSGFAALLRSAGDDSDKLRYGDISDYDNRGGAAGRDVEMTELFSRRDIEAATPTSVSLPRRLLSGKSTPRNAEGVKLTKSNKLDSFDFDTFESFVQREKMGNPHKSSVKSLQRWLIIFLSALLIGLVAVLITYSNRHLSEFKFEMMHDIIAQGGDLNDNRMKTLATLLGISVGFALIATIPVALISPVAGGSGIPQLKCILNGVKIPEVLGVKTLICKIVSVTFACASGLPMGKEGPMIHNGAIVASSVSQKLSKTCMNRSFRTDREKRDFIVCGAAAGVAAAFGAPVGGLLFALEEAASFWFQSLTWRAFVCAMCGAYVLDMFLSGINSGSSWGKLSKNAMFTFGDFTSADNQRTPWTVYEIPFFLVIGALGGFIGAMFNAAHKRLAIWRNRRPRRAWYKMSEVLVIAAVMSLLSFLIPVMLGVCSPLPIDTRAHEFLVQFYCPTGEYSLLASLFLSPSETVIKMLFHFTSVNFDLPRLFLFFGFYLVMACLTLGTSIAAGLFYPSMVAGAALGRILGQLLQMAFSGKVVDPGTYAFIGCAAMLGGCMRMTVSIAVMMLESTGDYQYGLPIMAAIIAARWTGNLFTKSVYDVTIDLNHWPHLEDHVKKSVAANLVVTDIMTPNPVVLREVEKVGTVMDVLHGTAHNSFPVLHGNVTLEMNPRLGSLAGLVMRRHLCVLLQKRAFTPEPPPDYTRGEYFTWFLRRSTRQARSARDSRLVPWSELEADYPYFPDPKSITLSNQERECWMDLRPYINRTCYTVNRLAPVSRAFRLFRTLGLRYLVVVNDFGDCVGILTRAEFVEEHIMHSVEDSDTPARRESLIASGYPSLLSTASGFTPMRHDSIGGAGDDEDEAYEAVRQSRARTAVQIPEVVTVRHDEHSGGGMTPFDRRLSFNQTDRIPASIEKDSDNPLL